MDRMAGFMANLLYGLENGLTRGRPLTRRTVVDELLQVSAHRHLRRREQLLAHLAAVDALGQLACRAAPLGQLGAHLRLPVEAVRAVLLQLADRVGYGFPMAGKQDVRP